MKKAMSGYGIAFSLCTKNYFFAAAFFGAAFLTAFFAGAFFAGAAFFTTFFAAAFFAGAFFALIAIRDFPPFHTAAAD